MRGMNADLYKSRKIVIIISYLKRYYDLYLFLFHFLSSNNSLFSSYFLCGYATAKMYKQPINYFRNESETFFTDLYFGSSLNLSTSEVYTEKKKSFLYYKLYLLYSGQFYIFFFQRVRITFDFFFPSRIEALKLNTPAYVYFSTKYL